MKQFVLLVGFLLAVQFFAEEVQSSHYRGGTISYRPNPSSPHSVDFTFRLSFRRGAVFCDSSRVASRSFASTSFSNRWQVTRYYWSYYSSSSSGSANIYCSDFNAQEDWSEGNNSFTFTGSYSDDWWNVRITDGGNWIGGMTYSNPYDYMHLDARVNRTISGALNNSSPVSTLPLTVYVAKGIPSAIRIPVEDPDGDIVRCRNASYQECYRGMCTYFPHGVLDEGSCTLRYNGSGSVGQLFPIILKLEDFPPGTTQFDSSNTLGSVDLQFVVHITNITECSNYTVLNTTDRAANYRGITHKCDDSDITPGWYRFVGDAGTAIATSCVEMYHCGTYVPGWMNGSHPTQEEGVVNRTACYHYHGTCCKWKNNIRVRNCGGFYVYELVQPIAGCHLRYCGTGNSTICANRPCRNGGTCVTTYYGYMCYCPYGYSGTQCETNLFPCTSNPCGNGGSCYGGYGWYRCLCFYGYTGQQCQTYLYSCNSGPCLNGGTCQNVGGTYNCSCPSGYTGQQCQHAVRIQGGGSSGRLQVLHNGVWGTVCDDGWTMTNTHVVCRQLGFGGGLSYHNSGGGTGQIWLDQVSCSGSESTIQQCRHYGWGRHDCSHSEDVFVTCLPSGNNTCASSPCRNNGTCVTTSSGYRCYCPYGYSGTQCETNPHSCYSNPCGNGGCCVGGYGWYRCYCHYGYTGQQCQTYLNFCSSWTCRNGGTCHNYHYGYQCTCPYGFTGRQCETRTVCASRPCRNNGTCVTTYYGYRCYCPSRYSGTQCETSLYPCTSNPCGNGGSCYGGYLWYSCSCPHGYTGQQCQTSLKTRVTCGETFMQIDLLDQYFPGLDWRTLHLRNTTCRATKTPYTMRLRAPLDGCGVTYVEHDKKIAFWNEVRNEPSLWPGWGGNLSAISRGENVIIPFYCEYGRDKIVSTSFSPSKKRVYASEGSFGNFTFTMDLYQSSRYSTAYSVFDYPVVVYPNQPLWVQYEVKNTNADLVVFAENCRATTSTDPDSFPQHVFLERGCVRDPTMVYWYNPYNNVQQFSIRSFRFVYSNTFLVYLHCELLVCHRNTTNSRCAQGCISGSRRRRETDDMDGSDTYGLSVGPMKGPNAKTETDKQGGEETSSAKTAAIGAGVGIAVVALLVGILVLVKMLPGRRNRVPPKEAPPPAIIMNETVNSYEQHVIMEDGERAEVEI